MGNYEAMSLSELTVELENLRAELNKAVTDEEKRRISYAIDVVKNLKYEKEIENIEIPKVCDVAPNAVVSGRGTGLER